MLKIIEIPHCEKQCTCETLRAITKHIALQYAIWALDNNVNAQCKEEMETKNYTWLDIQVVTLVKWTLTKPKLLLAHAESQAPF